MPLPSSRNYRFWLEYKAMRQQSRLSPTPAQRPTIERLIGFLRGRTAPSTSEPHPTNDGIVIARPVRPKTQPPAPQPARELVERVIVHLRAPAPAPIPIEPKKGHTQSLPISHAPFYAPDMEHDPPTHPVKPERLTVALASREINSRLINPEIFPEGGQLLLRSVTGQQLGVVSLERDVLLGRAASKDDIELRAERINLSDLAGNDKGISRVHAMLRVNDLHRVQVVDMGSTNGTFLNRQRLDSFKPAHVRDGDEIQLGIFRLRVHFVGPKQ